MLIRIQFKTMRFSVCFSERPTNWRHITGTHICCSFKKCHRVDRTLKKKSCWLEREIGPRNGIENPDEKWCRGCLPRCFPSCQGFDVVSPCVLSAIFQIIQSIRMGMWWRRRLWTPALYPPNPPHALIAPGYPSPVHPPEVQRWMPLLGERGREASPWSWP